MADTSPLSPSLLLAAYCVLILVASLAGGWIPVAVRLTHTRLQMATSFVAGLMLGVGVWHMLPHAWHQIHSIDRVVAWFMGGFLVMFFIQRFFHFHHHDVPDEATESRAESRPPDHEPRHTHACAPTPNPPPAEHAARRLSWSGAALGLTLHSLIDGVALAASVQAEAGGAGHGWLAGLGTFLVIILHKPFDALAIVTLMARGGWSVVARQWVNGLFALAIPAGVGLFFAGGSVAGLESSPLVGAALSFAAGTFVCIATIDLLPEVQFHSHDRIKLSVALLAGLALAAALGRFETSGHDHHHGPVSVPGLERPGQTETAH